MGNKPCANQKVNIVNKPMLNVAADVSSSVYSSCEIYDDTFAINTSPEINTCIKIDSSMKINPEYKENNIKNDDSKLTEISINKSAPIPIKQSSPRKCHNCLSGCGSYRSKSLPDKKYKQNKKDIPYSFPTAFFNLSDLEKDLDFMLKNSRTRSSSIDSNPDEILDYLENIT